MFDADGSGDISFDEFWVTPPAHDLLPPAHDPVQSPLPLRATAMAEPTSVTLRHLLALQTWWEANVGVASVKAARLKRASAKGVTLYRLKPMEKIPVIEVTLTPVMEVTRPGTMACALIALVK